MELFLVISELELFFKTNKNKNRAENYLFINANQCYFLVYIRILSMLLTLIFGECETCFS